MEDTKNICVGDILTDNFNTLYLVVGINTDSNCIVCRTAEFDGMGAFRLNCVNGSDSHSVQIGDKICRIKYSVTVEIPVTVAYKTPLESIVTLKNPDHYEYLDHLSPDPYFDFIAWMHNYYRRKCLYDQGFVRTKLRQSDDLYVTAGDIYRNKSTNTYVLVVEAELHVDNLFVTAYESAPTEYTETDVAEHGGYYFSEIDTTILVDTRQEIQCTRRDNQLVIDSNYEYVRTVSQFKLNQFKTLLMIHDIHGENDHPLPDSIISLGYLDDGKQKWQSVEVGINYTRVQELLSSQWDKFKTSTLDLESMRGYGETKEDALKDYTKCFDAVYDELTKFHSLLHSGGEIPMEEMQYGFTPLDK